MRPHHPIQEATQPHSHRPAPAPPPVRCVGPAGAAASNDGPPTPIILAVVAAGRRQPPQPAQAPSAHHHHRCLHIIIINPAVPHGHPPRRRLQSDRRGPPRPPAVPGARRAVECAKARNGAVLIEGLGHRVQALAGLNKTHLEAVAHQCQMPTPRLVPRVRLPFHLQPTSLRLVDAGNGRVSISFSLLLSPSHDIKGGKGQSRCNVPLFWGVDWPVVVPQQPRTTTTNNTAPSTLLTRALTAAAAITSSSSSSVPSGGGGNAGAMVAFSSTDTVEWAALSARLAASTAAAAAAAAGAGSALPTTIPLVVLLTPQPPSPAAAAAAAGETAHASSLFLVGFSPTPASVSPSRPHYRRDTPPNLGSSGKEEEGGVAPETETEGVNALGGLPLPRLTLLAHLCQASDGRLYTVQEAFGLPSSFSSSSSASREEEGEDDCIVCLTERKAAILLPCRHCCACERCLPFLGRCPVCRAPFQRYLLLDDDAVVEQAEEDELEVVVDGEGGVAVAAR